MHDTILILFARGRWVREDELRDAYRCVLRNLEHQSAHPDLLIRRARQEHPDFMRALSDDAVNAAISFFAGRGQASGLSDLFGAALIDDIAIRLSGQGRPIAMAPVIRTLDGHNVTLPRLIELSDVVEISELQEMRDLISGPLLAAYPEIPLDGSAVEPATPSEWGCSLLALMFAAHQQDLKAISQSPARGRPTAA